MKKNVLLFVLFFAFSDYLYSQIELKSAAIHGDYSYIIDKRFGVNKASGPGFGGTVQFKINELFSFSFHGGYYYMTVDQDSALEKWNWRFWNERYKGIVSDNLKSDSAITASLVTEQRMDIYPVYVTLDADIIPDFFNKLHVKPYFGLGIIFYSRQLYLDETWKKYFSAVDYNFSYNYRNFAPTKTSNIWMGIAGMDIGYQFAENFLFDIGSHITFILNNNSHSDKDNFPFEKLINVKLGITFLY